MKKLIRFSIFLFLIICLCACSSGQSQTKLELPKIDRRPLPASWEIKQARWIPIFQPEHVGDEPFQVDLRSKDLSIVDARKNGTDLMYAVFDTRTIWPLEDMLPPEFNPKEFLELGKDPGLGVRSLHAAGITGQGVNIAIIDQVLLVDHQEYKDQIRLYEELSTSSNDDASMHGAAVASLAVGKTVGVAPGANLFFIGIGSMDATFSKYTEGVRRVIEINRQLPEGQKIRVLSIQRGWTPTDSGYEEMESAVQDAKREGIFVISSSLSQTYPGFKFNGLGRSPLSDPNGFESYEPGSWWESAYYGGDPKYESIMKDSLLIPMDSRTIASFTGTADYAFGRIGGWSWSIPYLSGMYALAVQVDPKVTPEKFWSVALQTGKYIQIPHENKTYQFGPILDPVNLIHTLHP